MRKLGGAAKKLQTMKEKRDLELVTTFVRSIKNFSVEIHLTFSYKHVRSHSV